MACNSSFCVLMAPCIQGANPGCQEKKWILQNWFSHCTRFKCNKYKMGSCIWTDCSQNKWLCINNSWNNSPIHQLMVDMHASEYRCPGQWSHTDHWCCLFISNIVLSDVPLISPVIFPHPFVGMTPCNSAWLCVIIWLYATLCCFKFYVAPYESFLLCGTITE